VLLQSHEVGLVLLQVIEFGLLEKTPKVSMRLKQYVSEDGDV
jgi:hypothetical protein